MKVEKQVPKKIETMMINSNGCFAMCPECMEPIFIGKVKDPMCNLKSLHCEHCGQVIDWREE